MAAFFQDVLDYALNPIFLKEVGKKFHYEERHLMELRGVAEQMLPFVRSEAFWAGQKSCIWNEELASELLLQEYGKYNQYIRENRFRYVARYHFPGSEEEFPLERMPQMLERLTPLVVCNEAFCILPKKSVVFVAELTQNAQTQCEGICLGCNSSNCPNRITDSSLTERPQADMLLNYGYSRILKHPTTNAISPNH